MVDVELYVSPILKAVLPPLTDEQKAKLESNIKKDGRVIDPILYWFDGQKNVVIDGMNRLPIAKKHKIPYRTEPVDIGKTYEQAEEWIWEHQAGRRNLTREQLGKWYNNVKDAHGGRRDTPQNEGKGPNDPLPSRQGGSSAERIASKAGTSAKTVKRAGARVETLEKCVVAVQKGVESGAFKASDEQIKTLAGLSESTQNAVAKRCRGGMLMKAALEAEGVKKPTRKPKAAPETNSGSEDQGSDGSDDAQSQGPQEPDFGKCPNCAGTKWEEDEFGVACAKCHHPHGEPAGDVDDDRLTTQRQKTLKTCEALLRAFDDLQAMKARQEHDGTTPWKADEVRATLEDMGVIRACKGLLAIAKRWK